MPKAKTRSGPQWRTAPGLGTGPTAADDSRAPDSPDEASRRELSPRRRPRSRRRPELTHDSTAAPEPAPPAEAAAGAPAGSGEEELYTHTTPNLRDGEPGHGAVATPVTGLAELPPDAPGSGADGSTAPPAMRALHPEPELAAPQVPLDVELPEQPPLNGRRRVGQAHRLGTGRASVTRYTDPDTSFSRSVRSLEPISDLEATAFAGRFAADFQSFDQDQPTRRAEVLRPLLADPQACTWGWSGEGRQRADSPQPNRIYRRSDVVVFVEVIVRITPYARACPSPDQHAPEPVGTADPPGLLGPSSAPPLADPRWVAGGSSWVRMTVPITRDHDDGRLVVDPHLVPDPSA